MQKFIKNFELELSILQPVPPPMANLVIGGSNALILHGLNIGREPEDIDIILFQPTPNQEKFVKTYFEPCMSYQKAEETLQEVRVWKHTKNGMVMNVILAKEEVMPPDLLSWFGVRMEFKINSIKNIIDAKISYSQGKNKIYLRAKDMKHLIDMKNLNFNI